MNRKRMYLLTGLGLLIAVTACTPTATTETQSTLNNQASAELFKKHVSFLASDDLLGREPGTPGYQTAAKYVADAFLELQLDPGGDDGTYFQQVPLRRGIRDRDSISLSIVDGAGVSLDLMENVDYVVGANVGNSVVNISAPLVFAGYGVVVEADDRDDFAGLDVKDKVVMTLRNTPTHLQSEERAYYGAQKRREASARGAIGTASLATPTTEAIFPFVRFVKSGMLDTAGMGWLDEHGQIYTRSPNLLGGASFSIAGAKKIFEHIERDWDEVIKASQTDSGVTPTFDTGLTINISANTDLEDIESPNVVGVIQGSDPLLKDEVVVLTAHLDHIGVSPIDAEDTINNGALDNAAGVATLIEAARLLKAGPQPRRTIIFLAVTAEEKGLLGAQYFAVNPTVPKENLVANINLDMPVLTYNFTDVIVYGGARSTLNEAIETAAQSMGIKVSPDPFPEQGIFTRSDHYRFVEEGIPSVMLATGHADGGGEAYMTHLETHYHQPSDDLTQPIDWQAGAKFADLKAKILDTVANAEQRPVWHDGDFFGIRFNGTFQSDLAD
ncbi:MAG: M20/M25/M40 family metallo-hydrolase [Pseudomonadales bacterium]|nr:M20/M25/M40 family metallo-hydrolase [Pseudomonadales bacterium]